MPCLWECDDCGALAESDPHAHDDWGGVIRVYGPECQECEVPMTFVADAGEYVWDRETDTVTFVGVTVV